MWRNRITPKDPEKPNLEESQNKSECQTYIKNVFFAGEPHLFRRKQTKNLTVTTGMRCKKD